MTINDFIPDLGTLVFLGVLALACGITSGIVSARHKRKNRAGNDKEDLDTAGYNCPELLTEEQKAELRRAVKSTPTIPYLQHPASNLPPKPKQTRQGAMIADRVATVTKSGKVYTGRCGKHEVVGFSIQEVLHELAEAVNLETVQNQ